jgi:hypothetical protein
MWTTSDGVQDVNDAKVTPATTAPKPKPKIFFFILTPILLFLKMIFYYFWHLNV